MVDCMVIMETNTQLPRKPYVPTDRIWRLNPPPPPPRHTTTEMSRQVHVTNKPEKSHISDICLKPGLYCSRRLQSQTALKVQHCWTLKPQSATADDSRPLALATVASWRKNTRATVGVCRRTGRLSATEVYTRLNSFRALIKYSDPQLTLDIGHNCYPFYHIIIYMMCKQMLNTCLIAFRKHGPLHHDIHSWQKRLLHPGMMCLFCDCFYFISPRGLRTGCLV